MKKELSILIEALKDLGEKDSAKIIKQSLMGPTPQRVEQYQATPINKQYLHGILDLIGLVPAYGEGADLLNAALYLSEGITPKNLLLAGLSLSSMVPGLGDISKVLKYGDSLAPEVVKSIALLMFQQQGKIKAVFDRLKDPKVVAAISKIPNGNLLVKYSDRMWLEVQKWISSILKSEAKSEVGQQLTGE